MLGLNMNRSNQKCLDDKPLCQVNIDGYVQEVDWTKDAATLVATSAEGEISLFNIQEGKKTWSQFGHTLGNSSCAINKNGSLVLSCGQDKRLLIMNGTDGAILTELQLPAWGEQVRFSFDEEKIAIASGKYLGILNTFVLDKLEDSSLRLLGPHESTVTSLAFSPLQSHKVATTAYGAVTIWDLKQLQPRKLKWQGSSLVSAWSPDGKFIATGDQDSTVHFWFADSGKDLQMYGFETKVLQLSWDPTGRFLATGGGRNPCIWDCTGKRGPENSRPIELEFHGTPISTLTFANKSQLLIVGDDEGWISCWSLSSPRRPIQTFQLPSSVSSLKFSPDDTLLSIGLGNGDLFMFPVVG